jgi:hypothetical protein
MGVTVVKKPDGRLALFSTIVDDFTVTDATPEQMEEYLIDEEDVGRPTSRRMIEAGQKDNRPGYVRVPGNGSERWRESLRIIGFVHGRERLLEVLAEMGFPDEDVSGISFRSAGDQDGD